MASVAWTECLAGGGERLGGGQAFTAYEDANTVSVRSLACTSRLGMEFTSSSHGRPPRSSSTSYPTSWAPGPLRHDRGGGGLECSVHLALSAGMPRGHAFWDQRVWDGILGMWQGGAGQERLDFI